MVTQAVAHSHLPAGSPWWCGASPTGHAASPDPASVSLTSRPAACLALIGHPPELEA